MHTTRTGAVRQLWIALFAAALMAVGVVLALRAMSFDSEMHHRYESALTLSQAAIEAQQASADLRSWQARNARELLRDGDAALPPSELAALVRASADLRNRLARLAELDMPPERKSRIAELQATLSGFERLGQGAASRSGTDLRVRRFRARHWFRRASSSTRSSTP